MASRTFYFSLESGEFVCTETTVGECTPGGAGAVAWFVQYLFDLAH